LIPLNQFIVNITNNKNNLCINMQFWNKILLFRLMYFCFCYSKVTAKSKTKWHRDPRFRRNVCSFSNVQTVCFRQTLYYFRQSFIRSPFSYLASLVLFFSPISFSLTLILTSVQVLFYFCWFFFHSSLCALYLNFLFYKY